MCKQKVQNGATGLQVLFFWEKDGVWLCEEDDEGNYWGGVNHTTKMMHKKSCWARCYSGC